MSYLSGPEGNSSMEGGLPERFLVVGGLLGFSSIRAAALELSKRVKICSLLRGPTDFWAAQIGFPERIPDLPRGSRVTLILPRMGCSILQLSRRPLLLRLEMDLEPTAMRAGFCFSTK